MSPFHKTHRKESVAVKAGKPKVRRWLIKLDRLFIEIALEKKGRK